MRVAYFTNRYPATTHAFIRREIRAMETLGVTVLRYALLPGDGKLVDIEDEREERDTRYILRAKAREIIWCCFATLFSRPFAAARVVRQAFKIGWRSERGILRHFVYIAEAAVFACWCRRDFVQHVHAHFGTNSATISMFAKHLSGIPYSFTAHGPDEFEKAELLALDVKLEHASFVVCVSSFGRSQLMRWSHPDQWRKIAVVHCGVDALFLDNPIVPPAAVPRLVCVGRLDAKKAQILLVRAVRRLRDAGTHCEIVLVGDGPYRKHVEEAIRHARLENAISVVGWASGQEVKTQMMSARGMVLPSFSENLPVVIMEAMALGRPVISTYVAGIPELVEPGKTGWLVPAGDEIALAKAIGEILDATVAELATIGAMGRRSIIERHDSLKEAGKLKKLFEAHMPAPSEPSRRPVSTAC
jgi:colanic acid/amylovoran biosynthesis glycosyltransferase